jgi:hypothetical protein
MSEEYIPFEAARADEYRLTVQVGEPSAPDGLTRVRLDGTGRIEAEQVLAAEQVSPDTRRAEQTSAGEQVTARASGELRRDDVEKLMYQASLFPWGRKFPSRAGIPDEAVTDWTLETTRGQRATLRMWLREAERDQAVSPVLAELRRQLDQMAEGKMYL